MSIVSSIARGFSGLRADVGGAPAPWDDYWYSPLGGGSVSGMRVSPASVKRLSTVIACVSAKARAFGTLPCVIYSDLSGGGKKVVKNHPLANLLRYRPNSMQTAFEYYQMLEGHIELRGNAFSEILSDSRGVIQELIPMHPDRVRVEQLSTGKLRYVYNDPLTNNTRALLQEEVFHVRDWSDTSQVGQSRIAMGADVFGVALAQQDYAGKYMKNDASAGMFMTGLNFKNKSEEDEYVRMLESAGTGDKRHRVRMLPPGVDIKALGVKPIEMQLLDARKASAVEICSMFNVLPHLVGVDAGKAATYASVEQFNLMHAQQCVLPMCVMWEQAIQRDLIQDDRFYAKFSMASLLRGDYATRMMGYATAIEHAWMSPDEARELEDMNPIAGGIGKKYFRPLNWTTLDAPVQATPAAGAEDDSAEEDDEQEDEDGSGADPGQQARLQSTLQLMAQGTGARCARREVNGMRRLIENQASLPEVDKFYAEQARFICEAFHFGPRKQLEVRQQCEFRKSDFMVLFAAEDYVGAVVRIEQIAATEPMKLANLAVQGVT